MERYRIHADVAVYYLTYSVVEWLPVFVEEATCRIITDSLTHCTRNKHLCVNAFVIMPTHMHLIVFDAAFDSTRLTRTLADFRKFTGRQLSDYCLGHFSPCFHATLKEQSTVDRDRRFWQPSRHPEAVYGDRFWQQKLDYLHDNPRRKGLVRAAKDWRFSSAAWYDAGGEGETDVPLAVIDW
jgi:hypothetical protein